MLDLCKVVIRSTLMTHKSGISVTELSKQYFEFAGENIPYKTLNFVTLELFLRSMPDVCQLKRIGGEIIVFGVVSQASAHIADLVSRQNNSKKGAKKKSSK